MKETYPPIKKELDNRLHIVHEFLKLKPPRYSGMDSTMDPHQFLDQIKKFGRMLRCQESLLIELVGYHLDDVAHHWYVSEIEGRNDNAEPLTWATFHEIFVNRFLPLSLQQTRAREFEHLKQENLTVTEYDAQFTRLSRYGCYLIPTERLKVERFV